MKHTITAVFSAILLALAGPVLAGDMECVLPYDVYEASVPHTDLENCPAQMEGEGRFCRISVVAEVATIFSFDEESGCLVEAKSFEEDEFTISIH